MFGSLIAHRTALHENMIVECSRLLIVIRSGDLVLSCFIFLSLMARGYSTWYENLSSRQHATHLARHASPDTVQSQSTGITCLIGISHRKEVGDVAILERRFISSRMDLGMLNFSFEFHTVLWTFDK